MHANMDNTHTFECGRGTCYLMRTRQHNCNESNTQCQRSHQLHTKKMAPIKTPAFNYRHFFSYFTILTFLLLVKHGTAQDEINVVLRVSEDETVGTLIGNINDHIPGEVRGVYVVLQETPTNSTSYLDFNVNTGELHVREELDYERNTAFLITMTVDGKYIECNVDVINVNDNSPQFRERTMNLSIGERAQVTTKFALSSVVDHDNQNFGIDVNSIVILSGNTDDTFGLNIRPIGGEVYFDLELLKELDYEVESSYDLIIIAYDTGNPRKNGTMNIRVQVQDDNDNQPIFNQSRYFTSVYENATVGTSVLQVEATDLDSGGFGHINYTIDHQRSDIEQKFDIDIELGYIIVNKELDYETQCRYELIVIATDGHQTTAVVTVEVQNVNDNPPQISLLFLNNENQTKIHEGIRSGDFVARISVSDPDMSDSECLEHSTDDAEVGVTLTGGDGLFDFLVVDTEPNIVTLVMTAAPDPTQTYPLRITATDSGVPPLSSYTEFTIRVTDSNTNPPQFSSDIYRQEIVHVLPPGSRVLQVDATDMDSAHTQSQLTYSIEGSSQWFAIDATSGWITTTARLNCREDPSPTFNVLATDSGSPPMTATAVVEITIQSTNQNQPLFDQSFYNVSVNEDVSVNQCILQLSATDGDCGAVLGFSISTPPGFSNPGPLDLTSQGNLCVYSHLDYETAQSYQFPVVVRDQGDMSTTAMVMVMVRDINDNSPQFHPSEYSVYLRQTQRRDQTIVTVRADDLDSGLGGTVQYSIASGDPQGLFRIQPQTGDISLNRAVPSSPRRYELTITAEDGLGVAASDAARVTITLLDSSTEPPAFDELYYRYTVDELVDVSTDVGTVHAESSTGYVTYSLLSSIPAGYFRIDSTSGVIYTTSAISYNTIQSVLLNVQATDSANIVAIAQVEIKIRDMNNHAPEYLVNELTISVQEDVTVGTIVYVATATDQDSGDNSLIRYALQTPSEYFEVSQVTGQIKTRQLLDYEDRTRFNLNIIARDHGSIPKQSTLQLTINLQDVNDNSPVFDQSSYHFIVVESFPPNRPIAQVTATDQDSDSAIVYLLGSAFSDIFGINPTSGELYSRVPLTEVDLSVYEVLVIAVDDGMRSADTTVTINIRDGSYNQPIFTKQHYSFTILEDEPANSVVGHVTATHQSGVVGILYTIVENTVPFRIDTHGQITNTRALNRELHSSYEFHVEARTDNDEAFTSSIPVTVQISDINDNAPVFQNTNQFTFDEGLPKGTLIGEVKALDNDLNANQRMTYFISQSSEAQSFSLNSQSGELFSNAVFDYEARHRYTLTITATDSGNPPLRTLQQLTINIRDINESPPVFESGDQNLSVDENVDIGYSVGSARARDSDSGRNGEIDYYITGGNEYGVFGVNVTTGKIYVQRPVDYEVAVAHSLKIRANDRALTNPKHVEKNVYITVNDKNDNAPVFIEDPVILHVFENEPIESVLYTFQATDQDSGALGRVRYSIVPDQSDDIAMFNLDTTTGGLKLRAALDYEAVQHLSLVVQAEDQDPVIADRMRSTVQCLILIRDQNDNAPTFVSRDTADVFEDEPVGYPILQLIALDTDSGENGRVTYSLTSGNEAGHFQLDADSGLLIVRSSLDHETISSFSLAIVATDHGVHHQTAQTTITIYVSDVNDNAPSFQQSVYNANIEENQPDGTFVTLVSATDPDLGSNSELTYLIPDGLAGNLFSIGADDGIIRTRQSLDRETQSLWIVTVYVRDGAFPALYDSTIVRVTVTDTNDNTPQFIDNVYNVSIPENKALPHIHTILANDADSPTEINYQIIDGNIDSVFTISPLSGDLSCTALDREQYPSYNLIVEATDSGSPPRSSTCTIHVTVLDENDNDPVFHQSSYNSAIYEDIGVGVSVLRVEATDADIGDNGNVTYYINNTDNGNFEIERDTGDIFTSGLFDRERMFRYHFEVFAIDSGLYGPRSQSVQVTVHILDKNDNPPVFTEYPYHIEISQPGNGESVIQVEALDADIGINADITYTITSPSEYFIINEDSGLITARNVPPIDVYRLELLATDAGDTPLSTTGVVEIQVGGALDRTALQFDQSAYSAIIEEHSAQDTLVTSVNAAQASSRAISYSFVSGNEQNAFNIGRVNGDIRVQTPEVLDYEVSTSIRLVVMATDGVGYGYTTVRVNLTDINDNAPKFGQDRYTSSVWEGNSRGTYVTLVSATDLDAGENGMVDYYIVEGNTQVAFAIDPPNTGIVKTNIMLDREIIIRDYRLIIEAIDYGNPPQSSRAVLKINIIDINDNAPFFPEYSTRSIREGSELGQEVLTVTANDLDLKHNLIYSFVNPAPAFSIDSFSGKISVAGELDHEMIREYTLTVKVNDGVHEATTDIHINIEDVNDNAPIFSQQSYQVNVDEGTESWQPLLSVNATDLDDGNNARINYTLLLTAPGFHIDQNTGVIYSNNTLEYNLSQNTKQLIVQATDNGVPSLTSVVPVQIIVRDINNHVPQFSQHSYSGSVAEDEVQGHTVLTVQATDDDIEHNNKKIDYSIIGGNSAKHFEVQPTTGAISILVDELDRETTSSYDLILQARDRGVPAQSSAVTVHITVTDVNDNAPLFTRNQYSATLREDAELYTTVLSVSATDADSNASLMYAITAGNEDNVFQISPEGGEITIRSHLNYEIKEQHQLSVEVTDTRDSQTDGLSSFTIVIVNVTDVNEFEPQFPKPMYIEHVQQDRPIGFVIFTANAHDKDGGYYGQIQYQLITDVEPQAGEFFTIDTYTGEVKTLRLFNESQLPISFRLTMRAMDQGSSYTDVPVSITIQPLSSIQPEFRDSGYSFSVPGNAKAGFFVGQLEVISGTDGEALNNVEYAMVDENEYFSIGQFTGRIAVIKDLQDESEQEVRDRRSLRWKRALESDEVVLRISASLGIGQTAETEINIAVNRSCDGCVALPNGDKNFSATPLVIVVVIVIIAIVAIVVVIILYLKRRERKRHSPGSLTESQDDHNSSIDQANTFQKDLSPPSYQFHNNHHIGHQNMHGQHIPPQYPPQSTTSASDRSSSGRGSAEDEEIEMINSAPTESQQRKPDSGVPDDDAISERSVNNCQDYLARLGIDSQKISQDIQHKQTPRHSKVLAGGTSMDSMHQFSDEGGGETTELDMQAILYTNPHDIDNTAPANHARAQQFNVDNPGGISLVEPDHTKHNPGALSSIINSEEELSGSYNWDYLLDWGPQYQPLADVFGEIARLKDDNIVPKKQPTHIVPQPQSRTIIKPNTNNPPPIITGAPPHAILAHQPSSSGSRSAPSSNGSTRTSQMISVPSSIQRSPISHESSFTSPAFSPSFTPSLSPLATRSPTISSLDTPNTTPSRSRRTHRDNMFILASSDSEKEIRI